MDENKLETTEEEIVKALVNTKKTLENLHEDDDDYDKLSLLKKINNSSLWLIHRLLVEIEVLKESKNALETDKFNNEMNLEKQEELIAEQKAEIERLTEENAILKGNPPMCVGRSNGKTIRAKLLAFDRMKEQNAELQKQVDELKEQNAQLSEMADYDKGIKRATNTEQRQRRKRFCKK